MDNHLWIIDILESFFKRTSLEQSEDKGFKRGDVHENLVKRQLEDSKAIGNVSEDKKWLEIKP